MYIYSNPILLNAYEVDYLKRRLLLLERQYQHFLYDEVSFDRAAMISKKMGRIQYWIATGTPE